MDIYFGWSPVVFLILLAVSLVLAARVWKDWKIAWLLPAMVLWFGLDWVLPSPWSDLAFWAFWLAVAAVIVTAVLPGEAQFTKVPLAVISVIIILGLLGSGWDWASSEDGDVTAATPTTQSPSATKAPSSEACDDQFVQDLDPNEQYRFVSDGFKGTSNEKREQLIEALGHDYRYLDFVSEQLFHKSIDETSLVVGDCLSTEGQSLYAETKGALMASGVKKGKASADSYNTGMEDGQAVVAKDRGISGNRSATVYTLADGTELVVMDRCGNIALPSPPDNLPPGKTDNPPPTDDTPPPTTTTEECPPGMHGKPPFCKDGPEKQRNTGDGPGKNADPGPGQYVAPKDMEKPGKTPRTNPPAPKPTPGKGNGGSSTPKPEPTFSHPAPEPSAPKPDNPETGCVPIPGVEDC